MSQTVPNSTPAPTNGANVKSALAAIKVYEQEVWHTYFLRQQRNLLRAGQQKFFIVKIEADNHDIQVVGTLDPSALKVLDAPNATATKT